MKKDRTPKPPANLTTVVKDGVLVISIDLTKEAGPSSTGKSTLIGTTHGIIDVGHGVQLSVNAFRKVAAAA
jgi:hypothetical protein